MFLKNQINCPNCKLPSIAPHKPFAQEDVRVLIRKMVKRGLCDPSDLDDEYIDPFTN